MRLRALMEDVCLAYGYSIQFQPPFLFEGRLYSYFMLDPGVENKALSLDQIFENKKMVIDTKDIEINGVNASDYEKTKGDVNG